MWRLLGGRFRDRVPAYGNGWYQGERDPQVFAAAARAVVDRGYRGLKLDPFGAATAELAPAELALAADIVAAVRAAVGPDVAVMLEMHGRFTSATAVRIAGCHPEWIEEPVPPDNLTALRRVRAGTSLPLATGERIHVLPEFGPLLEEGLVDIVQADLAHFGGLTGIPQARGMGRRVWRPDGAAQRVRSGRHGGQPPLRRGHPNHKVLEHFNNFADPWIGEVVVGAPTVDPADGRFPLPTAPGLGVRLDHAAAAEHPRTHVHFNLVEEGWERRGAPS